MRLTDLVSYCDNYLNLQRIGDAPEAMNGLQVANSGSVTRIAAAVDLCAVTVEMAADSGADLLLVHHGLFWGGPRPLVGPHRDRVAALIRRDIALYSAHLQLDCHPE